jgi:hypothetical protein
VAAWVNYSASERLQGVGHKQDDEDHHFVLAVDKQQKGWIISRYPASVTDYTPLSKFTVKQ